MKYTVIVPLYLAATTTAKPQTTAAPVAAWDQCGGTTYDGATECEGGYYCSTVNQYYAQCHPGTATTPSLPTTTPITPPPVCTTNCPKTAYAGINIAGFEFGCASDGTCNIGGHYDIVRDSNGLDQISHFITDWGLNAFRLPVGWQWLVDSIPGGPLNETRWKQYDRLVQGCLERGAAFCVLDIHNYGRWDTKVIGEAGGPTKGEFADLWGQLATKYRGLGRVGFGLMNEPHDMPSIDAWGDAVQAAVMAIREASPGTEQLILLPGDDWSSAGKFLENGSADVLSKITNPGGGTEGLILDVHKYLDHDNSGTNTECVTNNIEDAFAPLVVWLRENGRQAMVTETGGGNVESCVKYMCEQLGFLNDNADVYLGWFGWAAGGFSTGYPLSETPTLVNGVWVDTLLVEQCVAGAWV